MDRAGPVARLGRGGRAVPRGQWRANGSLVLPGPAYDRACWHVEGSRCGSREMICFQIRLTGKAKVLSAKNVSCHVVDRFTSAVIHNITIATFFSFII